MLNGAVWTPLVFLFLLRAVRGERPWASASLSGACIGMAWLSGHHQVPIFVTLAAAGAWLYYILKDGRPDWRMARLAALAMVFAPLVGALQILPAQEYGRLAYRWAGARDGLAWHNAIPYYVHAQHAVIPLHLFGILIPGYGENTGIFFGIVAAIPGAYRHRCLLARPPGEVLRRDRLGRLGLFAGRPQRFSRLHLCRGPVCGKGPRTRHGLAPV